MIYFHSYTFCFPSYLGARLSLHIPEVLVQIYLSKVGNAVSP